MTPHAIPITDELYQVGGHGLTAPEDAAIYLINYGGHLALVDAGCGRSVDQLLSNIQSIGVHPAQIAFLLLTHCHFDHTGGARALRGRLGCTVVMHQRDAGALEHGDDEVTAATWYGARLQPCIVDRKLTGPREDLVLGGRTITAIHIPGHSPGSVAYLTASAGRKVVFAQDVHGPLHPGLLSNRADYRMSLQRLIDLDADILCEGHYGIFTGKDRVVGFIRSFLDCP